jgi:uncharacterized membrane protein YdbT with pleckstrin-like domain
MDPAPGETILFEGHPSWRSILGFYIKGLGLALVAGAIGWFALSHGAGAGIFAGAFAIVVVVGLLKRIATTYVISNQRLHIRRGIVARRTQETRLDRVQNVNTAQSVLERLLQVGTVNFDTAGTEDSDFAFVGVADPGDVVKAVDRAQREAAAAPGL